MQKNRATKSMEVLCSTWFDLFHVKCTNISIIQLKSIQSNISNEWICDRCVLFELPFQSCVNLEDLDSLAYTCSDLESDSQQEILALICFIKINCRLKNIWIS